VPLPSVPSLWSRAVVAAAGCVGLAACAQEGAPVAAAAAADVAPTADASAAADTPAVPVPTLTSPGHGASPYVELSGQWHADVQRLVVVVWIGGFPDLIGIAGHLTWDPARLQLAGAESLPFSPESASTGFQYRAVQKELAPGRFAVGQARFRALSHPFAGPEGVAVQRAQWLRLEFAATGAGTSALGFDPATRLARKGTGELLAPEWVGATVTVPAAGGAP